jgi:hypothetical protein
MPRVGLEPTILAFERAKRAHALDRAATVIGYPLQYGDQYTNGYAQNPSTPTNFTELPCR